MIKRKGLVTLGLAAGLSLLASISAFENGSTATYDADGIWIRD